MLKTLNFIRIFVLIIPLFAGNTAIGQNLISSRQTSYYTYIYKLTDREAKKISGKKNQEIDSTFFHTLVDSFPTEREYSGKLAPGHYFKTFSERNLQKFYITTVPGFDVMVFNNNTDLCIRVYDLSGKIVKDADVHAGLKKLRFDDKTQLYTDRKSNRNGTLKVVYGGNIGFYDLSRTYNNPALKRDARKVLYGTPLIYIWRPVNFVIHLPIDIVKSAVNGYPRGTISMIGRFFRNSYYYVLGIFDSYYYDYYNNNRFRNKYTGYIVFNKPKYLPGDTVRFKAFITSKKGNLIKKPVKVILHTYKKEVELTRLTPYSDGCYEYKFFLHDSLDLQLDRSYSINLILKDEKEYISGSFKYEDYELKKTKLEIRTPSAVHYRGIPFSIFLKGTDENDLNLPDARIELLARPNDVRNYLSDHVYIPDTLLFLLRQLEPAGETTIAIPDSILPEANLSYKIEVRMLTSDNETVSETRDIEYYFLKKDFDISLQNDSLRFIYSINSKPLRKAVTILAQDNFGNKTEMLRSTTPCSIPINTIYRYYIIESDSLTRQYDITSQSPLLTCGSQRTKDSVSLFIDNPRKLPFTYSIYRRNTGVGSGYSDSLSFTRMNPGRQNYFILLRYLWGGVVKEEDYRIPYIDKSLNINVKQPQIVYPGQKAKVEILVTNPEGKPVPDVDLAAFSLTRKFGYSVPSVPYLGKERKNKVIINNFRLTDFYNNQGNSINLNYDKWKKLAGLDSIEYYRFSYPEKNFYRFEYVPENRTTQFAPFVFRNGEMQQIHVIYADNSPLWFSWSTNIRPYSFRIDSGYHNIILRTTNKLITIGKIHFDEGKKLIFSLNDDLVQKNIKIEKAGLELGSNEKRALYNYIFPYRNTFGSRYAFIEHWKGVDFLQFSSMNSYGQNFAGPVSGDITFNFIDNYTLKFFHEPFFEYDFNPGLLKLRSMDPEKKYPSSLSFYSNTMGLSDVVQTRENILKQWHAYLENQRYIKAQYRFPLSTTNGNGRLLISFDKESKNITDIPLNILLFRYDNPMFIRVYPGNIVMFHDLQKGYHKMIFLCPGNNYFIVDSIKINANGLNYCRVKLPVTYHRDAFSDTINKIIDQKTLNQEPLTRTEEADMRRFSTMYQQQFINSNSGNGTTVEGYVYDEETGEGLPGVTVMVKGTTTGTITDIKGHYSLNTPGPDDVLIFSYIGFKQLEIKVGYNTLINAGMVADVMALDEVIVVGYGISRKSALAGSVAGTSISNMPGTISGLALNSLTGKLAGLQITEFDGSPGMVAGITIRGNNTTFSKPPLIVVNGIVYTGNFNDISPELIMDISVLKDAEATGLYGAQGANGVIVIKTKDGTFRPADLRNTKGATFDSDFLEAASSASSIRKNFSDYAFWQPKLKTGADGKASFEVTFPDDVTNWDTYYLAANDQKQTGQSQSSIKSYKPLMAQLAIPRFMVTGDSTYVIGKSVNYSPDTVAIKTSFSINGKELLTKNYECINSAIDTLPVVAGNDSLTVKYFLTRSDGYFDGEQKKIPVYPIGIEDTKGRFYNLVKDTTMVMSFDSAMGKVHLYAAAGIIDVLCDEIGFMMHYLYNCNEQIASKLKALLAEKAIYSYEGKAFRHNLEIEKLIRLLQKNEEKDGLWGWWKNSESSDWLTLHVMEALMKARQAGYAVKIDEAGIISSLVWKLDGKNDPVAVLRMLKILKLMSANVDYNAYIKRAENSHINSLNTLLQFIEAKQLCKLSYSTDTIKSYVGKTFFGNIYYSDNKGGYDLLDNDVENTLLAYRVFKNDSLSDRSVLEKIRGYFMEQRQTGHWLNTYQSARVIETILPDLLNRKEKPQKPELELSGEISKSVKEFPFETELKPDSKLTVKKTGDFPVYLTLYQHYWNGNPEVKQSDLVVTSHFDKSDDNRLKAGSETKLIVDLEVKKNADYIMINIPIPGGCSYGNKNNYLRNEVHREYFKNQTVIFCQQLKRGKYTFEVNIIPRFSGRYTLNPVRAELMYFPTFNANNEKKRVIIN
jgi:TonB-dependent SusC/RagA subfamily outer membrane receptor